MLHTHCGCQGVHFGAKFDMPVVLPQDVLEEEVAVDAQLRLRESEHDLAQPQRLEEQIRARISSPFCAR